MNAEVSSTEHEDLSDFWNYNTFGLGHYYEYPEMSLHPETEGQNLVRSLGLDNIEGASPSDLMMANEVSKFGIGQPSNETHDADIPAVTTEKAEGAKASEPAFNESPEYAPTDINKAHAGPTTAGSPQQADPNQVRRDSEQPLASPNSGSSNRIGTPPATQEQQPGGMNVTPRHTDQWSDDGKAHSIPSTSATMATSQAMDDRHTRTVMGITTALQPNASPPHYARQQLQNQLNRRESRLREEYTPLEQEAPSAFKHSAQSHNQAHSHGPFLPNYPPASHVHPDAVRGSHGLPYPQNQNGYEIGHVYPSHSARIQGYHDRRSPYQSVSASSPPHSSSLPRLPPDSYYGTLHGNRPSQNMNTLSRPVMQHFEPYGQSFDTHRELAQQGHNYLKQEDSSPRSMASVPSAIDYGSDANALPEQRTLSDLEPNPTFDDREDKVRIGRIYDAMMNMSSAQDNDGMRKTWIALSKDKGKVRGVCMKVLNACYVSQNSSSPLQQSVKPQHHYDNLDERIDAVCDAFEAQKTMCKHLMEAPYLYQVVDDPNLAAMRVINNRKVNKGKKEAIEQGRKALKEKGRTVGAAYSTRSDFEDDFQDEGLEDADYDDDDAYSDPRNLPAYRSSAPSYSNPVPKRGRQAVTRQMSSDDSADATYGHPQPKKAKKSGSMYQLNDRNEMVDTSVNPHRKVRRTAQPISRMTTQNRRLSQSFQGNQGGYSGYATEFESDNAETGYSEGSDGFYMPTPEHH